MKTFWRNVGEVLQGAVMLIILAVAMVWENIFRVKSRAAAGMLRRCQCGHSASQHPHGPCYLCSCAAYTEEDIVR